MHRLGACFFWTMLGCALLEDSVVQAAERFSAEQLEFFENRIRPVLAEHCYQCHSGNAKNLKGGLRLDSRKRILAGGDSGPAVVLGAPNESLLLEALRYESLEMPPRGRLPDPVIEDLEKWIRLGAPAPEVHDRPEPSHRGLESDDNHWAFQPIRHSSLPRVRETAWPLQPLDYFILKRLEQADLRPVQDADRYTWLRRVSIDLTGLPPTVEEIHSFLHDASPQAHEAVADRLLASRAFGERWARHWLDLVGYADQIGTSNNVFAEHAWRYRDYVINSWNADVPFDRFVREQIAGDLLARSPSMKSIERQASAITATGFLVLGDLEIVEADKAKMRVDIIDQQLVKTTKAFLAMTVGCARCHDHKFDPISQRDYYAMAGFFYGAESVYKTDRGVWSDVIHRELPETASQKAARVLRLQAHEQQIANWVTEKSRLERRKQRVDQRLSDASENSSSTAAAETISSLNQTLQTISRQISRLERQLEHAEFFTPRVPRVYGVRDFTEPTDMQITIRGNPHALGDQVPRGFLTVLHHGSQVPSIPKSQSGRLELANWITSAQNPLTSRVIVNRIWQKLFGEGLVRSVDYFGVRGKQPTHPKLLDHLASGFMQRGWSRKDLIRSIVLSRTYRLGSGHDAVASQRDPSNELLWRANRRRLDAEALRDAMLASSGRLHHSLGGPALALEFIENVGNLDPKNVNPPSFGLSKWRPEQPMQRTVYLPVIRSSGQPGSAKLRNIFDFPQPAAMTGRRATTAVPTQALFLMNSEEVRHRASDLVAQVARIAERDDERLELLWLSTLNRAITPMEKNEALRFLQTTGGAWVELCRALYATNEFLMIL